MEVRAKLRHLRIAPRKVRLITDLVRGKEIAKARTILDFSLKKGARPLLKLLDSAVANAKNNLQLDEETLSIVKLTVDEGPKLKRWRATILLSSHLLAEMEKICDEFIFIRKGRTVLQSDLGGLMDRSLRGTGRGLERAFMNLAESS